MLKDILKSLFASSPTNPSVKKREQVTGSEFLTRLEDRVKSAGNKTTCVFIRAEHPDLVYLSLQTYLHTNDGRYPQDMLSKLGGNQIGLALSTDYETAKNLIIKFKEEYNQQISKMSFTLADYSLSRNFKDFLKKAQTES